MEVTWVIVIDDQHTPDQEQECRRLQRNTSSAVVDLQILQSIKGLALITCRRMLITTDKGEKAVQSKRDPAVLA